MASHSSAAVYPNGGRLVVVAGRVEADHRVEVDDAACLVFGDLDEPDAQVGMQGLLRDPGQAGYVAGQVGDEPAPQLTRVRIEQHGGLVVVAVAARRLPEPGIGVHVAGRAGDVAAVRAAPRAGVTARTAGQDGSAAQPAGVHRAEGRGGQCREDARVRGDRVGDAFASGQARADELAGVALVHLRAGGADHLAAVTAGDRGLAVEGGEFAGGQVDHVRAAAQPDRVRAGGLGGELVFPGPEVVAGGAGVVGGRPRSRARDEGFGIRSGCRGGQEAWPQRCWAAWRVTPSREPISAQE